MDTRYADLRLQHQSLGVGFFLSNTHGLQMDYHLQNFKLFKNNCLTSIFTSVLENNT